MLCGGNTPLKVRLLYIFIEAFIPAAQGSTNVTKSNTIEKMGTRQELHQDTEQVYHKELLN